MNWREIAQAWVTEAERLPNGERQVRLDRFAHNVARVKPGTVRRYVSALGFLDHLRKAVEPYRTTRGHTAVNTLLEELSPVEVHHLQLISRYSPAHFADTLLSVMDGLRRDQLATAWCEIRDSVRDGQAGKRPTNANEFRLKNSLIRTHALKAAANCLGQPSSQFTIVASPMMLAPFTADAVLLRPGPSGHCTGFRHVGDTGRPGLSSRLNEGVAAALAAARGFGTFYNVVQSPEDAEGMCERLHPLGPCGVGVILVNAADVRSVVLLVAERPGSRHPDLSRVLKRLLSERVRFPRSQALEAAQEVIPGGKPTAAPSAKKPSR